MLCQIFFHWRLTIHSAAEDLKARAGYAQSLSESQLREAENVTQALSSAEEAQNAAEEAVTNAQGNIDQARKDLSQV